MSELFNKLLALLPKNSSGVELVTWSMPKSDNGSPVLGIHWGGLEIRIMDAEGQANYPFEEPRRAGSFETLVFRAVQAAHGWEYSKYDHFGKLGTLGVVRYVLYKDLVTIANEIIDAENLSEGSMRLHVKSNAIGPICRKVFRFPVYRTKNGWAVVLDGDKIEDCRLRFGFEE
jgi:hypothetical protein